MTHKAFRLLAVFAMAGLVAPAVLAGVPTASADIPEFTDVFLNPLSTEIRYVPVSTSSLYQEFTFKAKVGLAEPALVSIEGTPPGLRLEQSVIPGIWKIIWDTSSFANDSDFTSKLFLVTFVAADPDLPTDTTELSIPFMLFKEGKFGPEMTLDKSRYLAGETAYVTIFDPRMDSDGRNVASEASLDATSVFVGGVEISISEVDTTDDPTAKSGTFRGSFILPAPLTVRYATSYAPDQSKSVDVSVKGVAFEKEKYTINQSAKIIAVTGDTTSPSDLKLNGMDVSATAWVNNAGKFEIPLELTALGTNTVSVSIGGATFTDEVNVENLVAVFVNSTSQDQEISLFYSNQTAAVKVVDHQMNQDRTKAETNNQLTVRTTHDALDVPISLLETGVDTGIFTGTHLIGFTNETNSDPDSKLVKINPLMSQNTTLTLHYSGIDRASATVTSAAREESNQGIGGSSGTPVAAESIISITNLSCGSYGGDVERDGICDGWEAPTKTYLTIPYGGSNHVFTYACDPDCPHSSNDDILLEIDVLDGAGPTTNVMPTIKAKFDDRGYNLHYRIDNDVINLELEGGSPVLNVWDDPTSEDSCSSNNYDSFREIKLKFFGENDNERLWSTTDGSGCEITAQNNKGAAKKQVWHYCLYGLTAKQKWSGGIAGTSGLSEQIGNDCVVTLGDFSPVDQNKEMGTLMHELGHNFGLRHGGGVNSITANPLVWINDSNANCKPNYISPMSYTHQFPNALGTVTLDYWTPSYSNYALESYDVDDPLASNQEQLNERDGPNPNSGTIDVAWVIDADGFPNNKAIPSGTGDTGSSDDVNWDGGTWVTSTWNQNVNNFGFRDCNTETITKAPGGIIRGFRDWNKLVLEMRVYGGSNWDVPGSFAESRELDDPVWTEILKSGVEVINTKVQQLDEDDFNQESYNATELKAEFANILVGSPSSNSTAIGPVPRDPVVTMIEKGEIALAIGQLLTIMSVIDGQDGGDPNDDVILNGDGKESVFNSTKGNIRTLALELLEEEHEAFGLSWSNYNDVFLVVVAAGPEVNATGGRFFIHEKDPDNASNNNIKFTVQGSGEIALDLDSGLVNGSLTSGNTTVLVDGIQVPATIVDSTSKAFGSHIEFEIDAGGDPNAIHEVVIMGANIIPEFSATSILILAVAIILIIGFTALTARRNGSLSALLPRR